MSATDGGTNPQKRFDYVTHGKAKQKIVHGRGPSNINRGIFVCFFDVCRAS